jgi:hypothetical protein
MGAIDFRPTGSVSAGAKEMGETLKRALFDFLRLPSNGPAGWILWSAFDLPANRFSREALCFDTAVGQKGFAAAAEQLLARFVPRIEITGQGCIPEHGPLLIASNHPGTFDALAIASALPRDDLRVVAGGHPFLRALPFTSKHLIFSGRDVRAKMTAARAAIRHLREGGALLIFPSGTVDPDPACLPDAAVAALQIWSSSLELLLRAVPQTWIQVAALSGFLARESWHHPLTRLRRTRLERQMIAEVLQAIGHLIFNCKFSNVPRVTFSNPVAASTLAQGPGGVLASIQNIARKCLSELS